MMIYVPRPPENSRGFSLLEVLTSIVIGTTIIAAVSSLYVHMADQLALNEALREAEQLRGYVQGLMDQPQLCGAALTNQNNNLFKWVGATDPRNTQATAFVPKLWGPAGTSILDPAGNYGRASKIVSMYLRKPIGYEGGPRSSTMTLGGQTFTTVSTKLVIITRPRASPNAPPIARTVDLAVMIDPQDRVRGCSSAMNVDPAANGRVVCDQTNSLDTTGGCGNQPDYFCAPIYYVAGFKANGKPVCACVPSCFSGPQGPQNAPSASGSGGGGSTPGGDTDSHGDGGAGVGSRSGGGSSE